MTRSLDGRPPDTEPTVDLRWLKPDIAIVVLGGEHDLASAPTVEGVVGEALLTCSHLIIDISPVEFIESTIIELLVHTKRDADNRGCHFNLVLDGAPLIESTLEICRVLPALNRVADVHSALESAPKHEAAHAPPSIRQLAPLAHRPD